MSSRRTIRLDHGEELFDDLYWMRDDNRTDKHPKIMEFIHAENNKSKQFIKSTDISSIEVNKVLKRKAFIQMNSNTRSRLHEYVNPILIINGYEYYYSDDDENILMRKKGNEEQLVLDTTEYSGEVGHYEISPNNQYIAFVTDFAGSEQYNLYIRDIQNQVYLTNRIIGVNSNERISQSFKWTFDSDAIIYICGSNATECAKHILTTAEDRTLYKEKSPSFGLNLDLTNDGEYIVLTSQGTNTNEVRLMKFNESSTNNFRLIIDRMEGNELIVDRSNRNFYLIFHDNKEYIDGVVYMSSSENIWHFEKWELVYAPPKLSILMNLEATKDYLILVEMKDCQKHLKVISTKISNEVEEVAFFDEQIFTFFMQKVNYDENNVDIMYMSAITPRKILEINLETKSILVKDSGELSNHNPEDYKTWRIYAPSSDDQMVPITLTSKKNTKFPAPLILFGYGAYSSAQQTWFLSSMLSLLDLGFVFAIAHVRGGIEKGRQWAIDGRLEKKINSFKDFINCAKYLIYQEITSQDLICAWGRSAGGTLVAGSMNMEPELFKAAVLDVPFCDVLVNLSDSTIPWSEYDRHEYGNPHVKSQYEAMKQYCPISNIKQALYPKIFISSALNDARVPFWEPLKYTAKLRQVLGEKAQIHLMTDLDGGHYSLWSSGRISLRWAFLVHALGLSVNK